MNIFDSEYHSYLGDNYFGFKTVIQNIVRMDEVLGTRIPKDKNQLRDKYIYENFLISESTLADGKFYGQWGLNHTLQSKVNDVTWFAGFLNSETSKYHGDVITIAYNYSDCQKVVKRNDHTYSTVPFQALYPFIEDGLIKENYNAANSILFNISKQDIDRPKITMYDLDANMNLNSDIANYLQYVLLIKGSEAVDPFIN